MTSSVSAANPTTNSGRPVFIWLMVARMSGFSANSSTGNAPSRFLIFDPEAEATRQSATAAANTAASTGSAACAASSICCAVSTATTFTPSGGGTSAGPVTKVTSAPSAASALAIAAPCAPDDRLAMKRTGSIGSWVGPDVTSTRLPLSGPSDSAAEAASTICIGSTIRPAPYSPQAMSPSSGPRTVTPSCSNSDRLRCVAG